MKASKFKGKSLFIIFIVLLVTYSSLIGPVSVLAANPGHAATSISQGTFESGHYIFPNNLSVTQNFSVDSDVLFVDSVLDRIGIGTTGPDSSLHVIGGVCVESSDSGCTESPGNMKANTMTAATQFSGPSTGLTGTASSLTVGAGDSATSFFSSGTIEDDRLSFTLQDAVTDGGCTNCILDGMVSNTLTASTATSATTATTANSGDSATSFFSSGSISTTYTDAKCTSSTCTDPIASCTNVYGCSHDSMTGAGTYDTCAEIDNCAFAQLYFGSDDYIDWNDASNYLEFYADGGLRDAYLLGKGFYDKDIGWVDIIGIQESGTTPLTFSGCDSGTCSISMDIDGSGLCTAGYACTGGHEHYRLYANDGSPTNALYVDAAGEVGIGTTGALGKLHIRHTFNDPGARANYIYLDDSTNTNLKAYIGINRNTGAGADKEYLSIEAVEETVHWLDIALAADGGNVGIGTTDPGGYRLRVVGTSRLDQQAWQSVSFQNSWANYGGWGPAAYFKDSMGIVHTRGLVQGGTLGANIFNLPSGYRPAYNQMFSVHTNNNAECRLDIQTGGNVYIYTAPFGCANAYVSLDGITFRAA